MKALETVSDRATVSGNSVQMRRRDAIVSPATGTILLILLFLLQGTLGRADVINLIENPSFEFHDRGEVMFWSYAEATESGTRLGPVSIATVERISYQRSAETAHMGEGAVVFQTSDPSMRWGLQYWRQIGEHQLEIAQWQRSPVHVWAWVRGTIPGAVVVLQLRAFTRNGSGMYSERFLLSDTAWQPITLTLPVDRFGGEPIERLDLRIFFAEGDGQLWCDDVEVYDDLYAGETVTAEAGVSIGADGYLRLSDGTSFVPQVLWGAGVYSHPTALRPLYRLLAEQGFNTLYLMPTYALNYATKRHLQIMLDVAYEVGLRAIVQVPIYPLHEASCRFHRDYVQDWITTFHTHPALLAWLLLDDPTPACLDQRLWRGTGGERPDDWIREAEGDKSHPIILGTSEAVFADPQPGAVAGRLADMARVADILWPTLSPLSDPALPVGSANSLAVRLALSATEAVSAIGIPRPRAVWGSVQIAPRPDAVALGAPTAEQVETMATQALLNGARGLIYHTASLCLDPLCQSSWSLPGQANTLWRQLPNVLSRISDIADTQQQYFRAAEGMPIRLVGDSPDGTPWFEEGVLATQNLGGTRFDDGQLTLARTALGESAILIRPNMEAMQSALQGQRVGRATLRLWAGERAGDGFGTVYLYQVTGAWSPASVSWEAPPLLASRPEAVTDVQGWTEADPVYADAHYLEWDVTRLVRGWIDGTIAPHGVYLRLGIVAGDAMVLSFPSSYAPIIPSLRPSFAPQLTVWTGEPKRPLPMVDDQREDVESVALGLAPDGRIQIVAIRTAERAGGDSVRFYAPDLADTQLAVLGSAELIRVDPFGYFSDELPLHEVRRYAGGLSDEEVARRRADVNRDGGIDILDLVTVGSHFGESSPEGLLAADVNADGVVDILDLTQVARLFGTRFAAPARSAGTIAAHWHEIPEGVELRLLRSLRAVMLVLASPGVSDVLPDRPGLLRLPLEQTPFGWQSVILALGEDEIGPKDVLLRGTDASLLIDGTGVDALGRVVSLVPVRKPDAALRTTLGANYPNPFNPETWIPFTLSEAGSVRIEIHDSMGHLVRRFDLGYRPAGEYLARDRALYWDGRNAQGERVASGTYFYRLRVDTTDLVRKLAVRK